MICITGTPDEPTVYHSNAASHEPNLGAVQLNDSRVSEMKQGIQTFKSNKPKDPKETFFEPVMLPQSRRTCICPRIARSPSILGRCALELETCKWVCRAWSRSLWQRFPGILPRLRATEPFSAQRLQRHFDGISRSRIVADRFHVIRLINQHFLACWREIDSIGSKHRGLVSLMRRHRHHLSPQQQERLAAYLRQHPAFEAIYSFKQRLCYLLLEKAQTPNVAAAWPTAYRAISQPSVVAGSRRSCNSAIRFIRGLRRLPACGASPATTESPKASTPKWKCFSAKPTASATSGTTGWGLR
jgi:hypothetical protein